MTSIKKISVLALLCLVSNSAWPRNVDFCKVVRTFDEKLGTPPVISHETCSGVAYLAYGKDLVKASCWPGAVDLLEGKCESQKDQGSDSKQEADDIFEKGPETK